MIFNRGEINIYYEVQGAGQALMMIHGAGADASMYAETAKLLAKPYRVVTYDRRGNSRSKTDNPISYDLDTQVADAKELLKYLGIEKVILVGASAGAVIAHRFLMLYPEMVEKVILYEQASLALLESTDDSRREWIDKMKSLIGRRRFNSAMLEFIQGVGTIDNRAPEKTQEQNLVEMENYIHMLRNEFETFMEYQPDLKKSLELKDKIILAVGDGSRNLPCALATRKFADLLGKKALYYPGYHNLPYDLPTEFAVCVLGTLLIM